MALIKHQKSTLEMAWARDSKTRKYNVGEKMEAKNGHDSRCRAFPKVRICHNDTKHVSKGLVHTKGPQND